MVFEDLFIYLLFFAGNKFSVIPDQIGNFPNLTSLNVAQNKIVELPLSLIKLKKLTYLNASDCPLSDLSGFPFNDLKKLKELFFTTCKLTKFSSLVDELSCLQVLDLGVNQLTKIPKQIGYIGNSLGRLALNENILSELPGEIGMLDPSLKIDLSGNPLRPPFDLWSSSVPELFEHLLPYCSAWGPNCEIVGEAVESGVKLKGLSFKIKAKDFKGRQRLNGGDHFEISIIKEVNDDIYQVEAILKDHKNGTYEVFYNSEQSGNFIVTISCESNPLPGSPYKLVIFDS